MLQYCSGLDKLVCTSGLYWRFMQKYAKLYRSRYTSVPIAIEYAIYYRTPCNLGYLSTKSAKWNRLKFVLQTFKDMLIKILQREAYSILYRRTRAIQIKNSIVGQC